jgi:hypothetical protein
MKTSPRFSFGWPALIGFAAVLMLSKPAAAQIIVTTLTDENDLPAGEKISLREAIRDSADGGQITLDPALAGSALALTMDELAVTGKTLAILAPGGLVIDGRGHTRLFNVSGVGAGLSLSGVTLQNGRPSSGNGGAILCSGTLTLTDCVLRENRVPSGARGADGYNGGIIGMFADGGAGGLGGPGGSGGAIHNYGRLTALRSQFIDNVAGDGGNGGNGGDASGFPPNGAGGVGGTGGEGGSGGAIFNVGPLELTSCFFLGNAAGMGGDGGNTGAVVFRTQYGSNGGNSGNGGAVSQSGIIMVDRSTFTGNRCVRGGFEQQSQSSPVISQSFPGIAGSGAAVSCAGGGSATFKNSTFFANSLEAGGLLPPSEGGTIRAYQPLRLVHCTVTGNTADYSPAAPNLVLPPTSGVAAPSVRCENSIVTRNALSADVRVPQFYPEMPVLIPAGSPGTTPGVELLLSAPSIASGFLPVLIPDAASPLVNAGADLTDPLTIDQRGLPRPVGAPDPGAVEVQDPEPALLTPQVITFSPPETAATPSLTLGAVASSGLPVSLSVVSGAATLNGKVLTFAGPGYAVVRASQSGDATRAPALPVVRIIGYLFAQTIPFNPPVSYPVYSGSQTTVTLPAATSNGLPVIWTLASAPPEGFSLTGNTLGANKIGTVQIRGKNSGDAQHLMVENTWTLTFVTGTVKWLPPPGPGSPGFNWFTFVPGSPHGTPLTATLSAPHTGPLPVPALPPGLEATPDVIPAGETSLTCVITAIPGISNNHLFLPFPPPDFSRFFGIVNRADVPLTVTAPATLQAGVSGQVTASIPASFTVNGAPFEAPDLTVRTLTVSAVDFDHPDIPVPVTLVSSSNATEGTIVFPPMNRWVTLRVTTDDGITGQTIVTVTSGANTDSDSDGISDLMKTVLQLSPVQRNAPPLTIERDAAGVHAVLASRPVNLQGWTVEIEQSNDLQTWTPIPAAVTTVTPNPGGTTERISVLLPADGVTYFVRLKASKP